ncbi:hypothetical protein LOK49_LG07G02416, partial [Camellia lanceoleosa]
MVEGRDGEGRIAEGGDCHGRSMAEGGDCHGEGRSTAEGRDAMARRDCCPEEGDGICTPEGQSEAHVAMGNICSQGVYTSQGQSRPPFGMSSNYVEVIFYIVCVYTPQGQSRPPFGMSSNYVEGHGRAIYNSQSQSESRPESQSQPPFAMGRTYDGNNAPQSMPPHSMPLVYSSQTSFQELLRGSSAWLVIREIGQVKFLVAQRVKPNVCSSQASLSSSLALAPRLSQTSSATFPGQFTPIFGLFWPLLPYLLCVSAPSGESTASTPLEPQSRLTPLDGTLLSDATLYRQLVGSLVYLTWQAQSRPRQQTKICK